MANGEKRVRTEVAVMAVEQPFILDACGMAKHGIFSFKCYPQFFLLHPEALLESIVASTVCQHL